MSEKPYVKFIGDIHGQPRLHLNVVRNTEYTVQVGDLGFEYDYLNERDVDSEHHKFFGGNHDNYDIIDNYPHNLGGFGVHEIPEFGEFFFVRGGWSIDRALRRNRESQVGHLLFRKNLWDEEELSMQECEQALELYQKVKPKLLVSHECPLNIVQHVGNPRIAEGFGYDSVIKTRTNQLLQAMTDFHRPKIHIFGHFHVQFDEYINGVTGEVKPPSIPDDHEQYFTRYVCLAEGKTIEFPRGFISAL